MRSASRIFLGLGLFGLAAALLFFVGYRDDEAVRGSLILVVFAIACGFLAVLLRPQGLRELDGLHVPELHDDTEGEIHLPGPSIYPALYGVSGAALFFGLVFNYPLAWAGGVALVLTSIGWARESVIDYRREIAHASHDVPDIHPLAVDAAHRVQAFARAHGGADAVVQHLGNGHAEIAVVGADGAWGTIAVRRHREAVTFARRAVELAGVGLHDTWPHTVASRIAGDVEHWRGMAGSAAPHAPHGPRDPATQIGARIFLGLGIFGLIAGLLFWTGYRDRAAVRGTLILVAFGIACGYLWVAMRNARGGADDLVLADADSIAPEPINPDPPVDLETLHLPGPSIWPAGYAVGGGLLMFGLIFNYALAWIGGAVLVLSSIGWAIESVREYRAATGGHGHGAHHELPDRTAGAH